MYINKLTLSRTNTVLTNPSTEQAYKTLKKELYMPQDIFITQNPQKHIEKLVKRIENILSDQTLIDYKKGFSELLESSLEEIMQEKNIIGSGFHEAVYRLNDKYVAKFSPPLNPFQLSLLFLKKDVFVHPQKYNDLLTYKGNILIQTGGAKILENLGTHIPAGVPRIYDTKISPKNYYNNEYLPAFAKVSQENYNAIMEDCGRLNDRFNSTREYHLFDTINPNNIVLKDGKLYWVDEIRTTYKDWNSITYVLDMMLNKINISKRIYDGYGDSLCHARTIFKKILLAGMNADVPVRGTSYYTEEMWTNLLKNLEINTQPKDVIEHLEAIYRTIDEKEVRVTETIKYLDNLLKPEPKIVNAG